MSTSKDRIQETLKAWGPIYAEKGIKLTDEDARQISENLWEFFSVLARWDKEDKQKKET
jgi:hypothetical protein